MKISDLYLGDVSSSIHEWLYFNKPMVFINTHKVDWKNNHYYEFWQLGNVVNKINNLIPTIDIAINKDPYNKIRNNIKDYIFDNINGKSSYRTAKKLYTFLITLKF